MSKEAPVTSGPVNSASWAEMMRETVKSPELDPEITRMQSPSSQERVSLSSSGMKATLVDASGIDTRIVTCLPSRKSLSTGISLAQDS